MADSLTKYGSDLLKGINVQRWNLSTDLLLDGDSFNLLSGITEGLGPRYGMAPIPGHMDNEAVANPTLPGLVRAETGFSVAVANTWARVNVFGIIPFRLRGSGLLGNMGTISTSYAVIVGYTTSLQAGTYLDVLLLGNMGYGGGSFFTHLSDISAGLQPVGADSIMSNVAPNTPCLMGEKLASTVHDVVGNVRTGQRASMLNLLKLAAGTNYVCFTPFSVLGADVQMPWMIGGVVAAPDATHSPALNLSIAPEVTFGSYVSGGQPSYLAPLTFNKTQRDMFWYCMGANYQKIDINYSKTLVDPTTIYNGSNVENPSDTNIQKVTATKGGGSAAYGSVTSALFNDPQSVTNNGHQGTLIAAGKPIAVIYNDWFYSQLGEMQQYIDLTTLPKPATNNYGTGSLVFGAAGTGVLSQDTTYEFGVAQFDKRLGYETNVVLFKTAATGANDAVNACLNTGTADTMAGAYVSTSLTENLKLPAISTSTVTCPPQHLNFMEYRFYYRPAGSFEWLPALFIDAAKYWFYPWAGGDLNLCSAGVGGGTGGQPGGFNDYSSLPQEIYDCVVLFQNRAFWFSAKSVAFSMQNNVYCYPNRNTVACPAGSFKGATLHTYYGQSEQGGRIVVWSTRGAFVGKFTGNKIQAPVTVGFDPASGPVIGNFDLDGSDFILSPWTSNTAFSYRSAVVGEGILYFWGPQGIFMDNGVQTPVRISKELEPDIFTYYDPSKTDLIHCLYNDTTKEVFWFFAPKTADGFVTHALVYNTIRKKFDRVKFAGQVDAAQTLAVDTALGTSGGRGVLIARQNAGTSIQRAYYFDQMNRAGDMFPTSELMVKQLSTPSAGVRRLTMAAGHANLASVAVNDFICLQQMTDYANGAMTSPIDLIGKIKAVNAGAGTLDFFLPAAATALDAAYSPSHANYFPAYHLAAGGAGLNGIPWKMPTKYWMPAGVNMSMIWLHLYLLFQVKLLAADALTTIGLKYRTPVSSVPTSDGFVAESFQLSDNSDGNFQIYRNLQLINRSVEGQAMRWILSGNHIGHAWVLQWLEAHGNDQTFDFLKEFEG